MEDFDLKSFISFCKVVELRSFSEAANLLCVTQPTISSHINKLENSLGVVLIDRQGKTLELTEAGKIFYRKVKKIIKDIEDAKASIEEIKGLKKGIIDIGASTIPGEYILPKVIAYFNKQFPNIYINVHIKDTFTIIDEIIHGNYDFGIVGSKQTSNNLIFEKLIKDKIILVAPLSFDINDKISVDELKKYKFIGREKTSGTFYSVYQKMNKLNIELSNFDFVFTVGTANAVKELLKAEVGITFISKLAVIEEIKRGFLKEVKVENITPIQRYFYFVKKKNSSLSNSSKKFYEIMLKFINNYVNGGD